MIDHACASACGHWLELDGSSVVAEQWTEIVPEQVLASELGTTAAEIVGTSHVHPALPDRNEGPATSVAFVIGETLLSGVASHSVREDLVTVGDE